MNKKHSNRFIPLLIAISVVGGIVIGTFYARRMGGNPMGVINGSSNKINALLHIINDQYVDTVHINDLIEQAMPQILSELDPHSVYIPAQNAEDVNDQLKGSFSGIGIQFTIQQDTIHVNAVVPGGPSEKVGVMPGDRIIAVDDSTFVGKKVTNSAALHKLKGPKGSKVKLGIHRPGEAQPLSFMVVRDDIPVKSVDAAYMLNDKFGYIRINKFGDTTYPELLVALAQLSQSNMQGLVIDLRGNTGGFMGAAIQMVNEFLPKNRLIVYTEGRRSPRKDYSSNGTGSSQHLPLVVLVDEGSASSSEIFAGAIQDNDRGTIVGRRTFGKGLVQQAIEFTDGSAIRLTIARYYTPSGRSIQKHYERGDAEKYEMDIMNRWNHGEFFSPDSIKFDKNKVYHTRLGRKVYGGGGIMPDIFVPEDTTGITSYYRMAASKGLIQQFAFRYTDSNRELLKPYKDAQALEKYLNKQNLLEQFAQFAEQRGLKRRNLLMARSKKLFDMNLKGSIIYNMLSMEEYIKYLNKTDETVKKGLEILEAGKSIPEVDSKTQDNEPQPTNKKRAA